MPSLSLHGCPEKLAVRHLPLNRPTQKAGKHAYLSPHPENAINGYRHQLAHGQRGARGQ